MFVAGPVREQVRAMTEAAARGGMDGESSFKRGLKDEKRSGWMKENQICSSGEVYMLRIH